MNASRLVACCCLALWACTETPAPHQPTGPSLTVGEGGAVLPIDHPPVEGMGGGSAGGGSGAGGGDATGGGGGAPPSLAAQLQRLSVPQLAASMPVVLGGNTWKIGSAVGFTARASTLGQADYINLTQDNLEVSPLYLKFMDDAARDACKDTADGDAALAASARVLMRFVSLTDTVASNAAGVDQNLRYLKLRFHGVKVPAADDAPIAGLRSLFDTAVKASAGTGAIDAGDVKEGWKAVCVALMSAPEYHLY